MILGPRNLTACPLHGVKVAYVELWNPFEPDAQGDVHLQSGQVGAGTTVNPRSKCHMAVSLTVDDELVGVLEVLRVMASRRKVHEHLVTSF